MALIPDYRGTKPAQSCEGLPRFGLHNFGLPMLFFAAAGLLLLMMRQGYDNLFLWIIGMTMGPLVCAYGILLSVRVIARTARGGGSIVEFSVSSAPFFANLALLIVFVTQI